MPLHVLVTGSSGYLGAAVVQALRARGDRCQGLDPVAGPHTDIVGSVADGALIDRVFDQHGFDAVIAAGALHKPQVATHPRQAFVDVNVTGTLHLLEAAVQHRASRFVFTSTTSLMISQALRDGAHDAAVWFGEDFGPLWPRNIYGVTKLAAEHHVRLMHQLHGLPCVVLRTSRFFPEEDDAAHTYPQSQDNAKTNELLFRRLSLPDAVQGHLCALDRAPELGLDTFILSAPTPFARAHCAALAQDAPAVVEQLFPHYPDIYQRRGWTMFDRIDRVYDASRAIDVLGWRPQDTFARRLRDLSGG